ncbi:plasmid pRiA4b ORF-3 family protein [Tautonia plasticadhaerens]|uniref:Plasmid pRiA4b ORF-3-like protein n=1 Tax=Tautonia plasticadhaerens TaxID=2527974 RepID=A0A518H4F0_9BACT|nr:plasmid pRiA4b ORF-3 family protein [Tautonia plasticadhaerens]QDV35703.1 Plasmid pRiA4b ORF-3-like protein [Tautonia plasticadhaerens]
MAKKKAEKPETKSDFLRRVLGRNPDLDYRQVNQRWRKAGHPGEISNPLYYLIRRELGIRTEWAWVKQPPTATRELFQFKITLLEIRPPIWRRIRVRDGTLDKLHEHIQAAMGWTNSHLHHFRIGGTLYGDPMLMAENFGEMKYRDSTTTLLSAILPRDDGLLSFEYEYDFGDGWRHEVTFEGRPTAAPGEKHPICLEGEGACPPEDVGGVWGYADFLQAIADRDHEEHDELLEWAGGTFDPEKFSPTTATRRMKQGLPDWRSMR